MGGSLSGAFTLLAVVLLAAVVGSGVFLLVVASGREQDAPASAEDPGAGLLRRSDGGARARARFERAERAVVGVVAPRRRPDEPLAQEALLEQRVPEGAAATATAASRGGATRAPQPEIEKTQAETEVRRAAEPTPEPESKPEPADAGRTDVPVAVPLGAPAQGRAPARIDLDALAARARQAVREVDLRARAQRGRAEAAAPRPPLIDRLAERVAGRIVPGAHRAYVEDDPETRPPAS